MFEQTPRQTPEHFTGATREIEEARVDLRRATEGIGSHEEGRARVKAAELASSKERELTKSEHIGRAGINIMTFRQSDLHEKGVSTDSLPSTAQEYGRAA